MESRISQSVRFRLMQAASHVSSLTLLALLVLASGFCRAQGLSDLVNSSQHQVVSGQHNSTVPVHSVEQSGPSPKLEGGSNSSVSASQKQPGFQQDNQTSNNLRGFQTCSNSATFPPALWQDDHCPAADTDEDSTVTTSEAGDNKPSHTRHVQTELELFLLLF